MNTSLDSEASHQVSAAVDRATGLALQADSAAATEELARVPESSFQGELANFRECMIERFGTQGSLKFDPPVQDPWLADLVRAYVVYWHDVLTKRQSLDEAEARLQAAVSSLIGLTFDGSDMSDTIEMEVQAEITRRGFHSLLGRTSPLLELMLWQTQHVAQAQVELSEGTYLVSVTYLDDFVLRGWAHYATCGRRSTGGWATEAGLFAVVPAYQSLHDETFTVRFLAHEAQHYADKQSFGQIADWELEYRAKLTELALATTTQVDTLRRMCENRSDSTQQAPHAYANFVVIRDLEQTLGGQAGPFDLCTGNLRDGQAVRDAAKALLIEDSRRRT